MSQCAWAGRDAQWLGMVKAPSSPTLSTLAPSSVCKSEGGFQIKILIVGTHPGFYTTSSPAPFRGFLIPQWTWDLYPQISSDEGMPSFCNIPENIRTTKCLGSLIRPIRWLACETVMIKGTTNTYLLKNKYVQDTRLRTVWTSCYLILTITLRWGVIFITIL